MSAPVDWFIYGHIAAGALLYRLPLWAIALGTVAWEAWEASPLLDDLVQPYGYPGFYDEGGPINSALDAVWNVGGWAAIRFGLHHAKSQHLGAPA